MLKHDLCVCGHYKKGRGNPRIIIMRRKRTRRRRSQRGRGFLQKAMAYNAQPLRLPGVGGYLGAKLALKVLGPKAQKQFAPFMSKLKKVTFI